ncbi:hypothetical protein BDN70DRAFT_898623 [Pholiota conissans]|uniref:Uncharacterized protein n=1 Tax=Pholiota conissans TaxID=109636 RepID=A0A9P6CW59_9AGAR|nr:hypothetical protein BDN70DRAFT_898623 [Pholiota conissans]
MSPFPYSYKRLNCPFRTAYIHKVRFASTTSIDACSYAFVYIFHIVQFVFGNQEPILALNSVSKIREQQGAQYLLTTSLVTCPLGWAKLCSPVLGTRKTSHLLFFPVSLHQSPPPSSIPTDFPRGSASPRSGSGGGGSTAPWFRPFSHVVRTASSPATPRTHQTPQQSHLEQQQQRWRPRDGASRQCLGNAAVPRTCSVGAIVYMRGLGSAGGLLGGMGGGNGGKRKGADEGPGGVLASPASVKWRGGDGKMDVKDE